MEFGPEDLMEKEAPLESTSPPKPSRTILTPPICVHKAPAKVAVREPSGPIQSIILRCTMRCARAL
eukprot:3371439-Pyramimonas_sp.AAC.1